MNTPKQEVPQGLLRTIVRGTYDIQELRIQMGNRLVGNFKVKLGIAPGTKEKDLSDTQKRKLLDVLRVEHQRITDGVITLNTEGEGVISTQTEMNLVGHYISMLAQEQSLFNDMEKVVEQFPLWQNFLKDVKGIGRAIAGVILSEFDIHKARYPSSLHAYAGLDVATDPKRAHIPDGKGRNRRKGHQITVKYIDKKGKEKERESITFNPFLKTKMVGVMGPSFLKQGMPCAPDCKKANCVKRGHHTTEYGSPYGVIYANERHRLKNHPDHMEKTPGHQHAMATRKMVKLFLIDLYVAWRTMEGLEVSKPYHEAKLGLQHKKAS